MKNIPTVTVVIPCFNDGDYLSEALQSVYAQTFQPSEILVIDDGSTEPGTVKILKSLDLSRVKTIHQENLGLPAARNTGLRSAGGKYVYFLDADDVIDPECLATLAQMLESNDAVAATSAVRISGGPEHGRVWGKPYNPYLILVCNQWSAGLMLRREATRRLGLNYDELMRSGYEDWEFNIRLGRTNHGILFSSRPLYEYRVRKKSLLSTTRKSHVEVVNYIRAKHRSLYEIESLVSLKRDHAPALRVICDDERSAKLRDWLLCQTFRDWAIQSTDGGGENGRYRLFFSSVDALWKLPPETLECALLSLECYPQVHRCLIAVRRGCTSFFALPSLTLSLDDRRTPVALITRHKSGDDLTLETALRDCDLVLEFIDQNPSAKNGWDPGRVQILPDSLVNRGFQLLRKNVRAVGKRIFGNNFERECIRVYDYLYYRMLCSESAFAVRNKIRSRLGDTAEKVISRCVYGAFLTEPPRGEDRTALAAGRTPADEIAPLFLGQADDRFHLLIATNWLIEGGVEQIIFEICRLLDPKRFRISIVTTLPSHHSWDRLAREVGASVYHLADFLKPTHMVRGFLHFVFNHHVDCMFIMNSEIAYRAARTLKRYSPWLSIVDRIEAPDPGGGFPMISARVGSGFIDLRTVSHKKLADFICKKYRLRKKPPRVIYIGINLRRIEEISRVAGGRLHAACHVSSETPIVLFVGRMVHQKRPEVFVRSVAKILKIHPSCEAHFAMVGDGDRMDVVRKLVSEHGLQDRIHLLGADANAATLLADATLLMMPSAYEGVALVSYEAMALGIPQIFANVGGQDELITPDTGILIKNGRDEETRYAQACLALLSNPERRARMADAGKARVRSQFTAEKAVEQYSEIFGQLAAGSRRRASEIPHLKPPHFDPLHDVF
ncbi:MAG TPA: glycosyltransferase [Candidatus Binatia bacterium]|nr:glycosyltransferase [Candidatus Binatia bacterium]